MGIPIDCITEQDVVSRIVGDHLDGRGGWVVTPNLDQMRLFRERRGLLEIASEASIMIADGMPLVWASWLQGTPLPARVSGSDLIISLTAAAARVGASVFLLGGSPGDAEAAAAVLTKLHPDLKIAGLLCPPRGFERDQDAVTAICNTVAAARPDIVYSCFGFPKQEWVIDQLRRSMPATWFLGLGGSFSMVAGNLPRAPEFMRRVGLEWMHRLALEPSRLFKRYIVHDAPFAIRLFSSALRDRWTLDQQNPRFASRGNAISFLSSARRNSPIDDDISRVMMKRYRSIGANERRRRWQSWRFALEHSIWRMLIRGGQVGKRIVDIIGSLIMLIALSPLLAAIALLIKLDSRGPVLFPQIRVGKWGKRFTMYKFRSMCVDAEHRKDELLSRNEMRGGVIFKMKRDPRVTRIGRVIRRGSLDELPQLWNVLRGEMSLVGPRPPVQTEVDTYTLDERLRLEVKPGITCIWQVSGRSQLSFSQQVELDLTYIQSQSLWGDFKLMLKTVPAVLIGRGAY